MRHQQIPALNGTIGWFFALHIILPFPKTTKFLLSGNKQNTTSIMTAKQVKVRLIFNVFFSKVNRQGQSSDSVSEKHH